MKNTAIVFALVLFLSFLTIAYAEDGPPDELIQLNKKVEKVFHYKKGGSKKFISLERGLTKPYSGKPQEAAEAFLKENHKLLFLSEDLSEIKFSRESGNDLGPAFDYKQNYKGIPVEKSGVFVHLDKYNRVYSITSSLLDISDDFNVEPVIKPSELQGTLKYTAPEFTIKEDSPPELMIYPINKNPVLVYVLKAYKGTMSKINLHRMIIDSSNGKVIKAYPMVTPD